MHEKQLKIHEEKYTKAALDAPTKRDEQIGDLQKALAEANAKLAGLGKSIVEEVEKWKAQAIEVRDNMETDTAKERLDWEIAGYTEALRAISEVINDLSDDEERSE
jgi:hypothetical protein